MGRLRGLGAAIAVAIAAGVFGFLLALPVDNRPTCAALGPLPDTCYGGPVPAEWYLNALPVGIGVFMVVLVGVRAAQLLLRKSVGE